MLKVRKTAVSIMETNCYIITDEQSGECAVVDPGDKSPVLCEVIEAIQPGMLKFILLTHGHYDHIGYVEELAAKTGAEVVIGKRDKDFLSTPKLNLSAYKNTLIKFDIEAKAVSQDDVILLGETEIKVLELPGHTGGGVGYLADGKLFCGDTLFKGSMGRIDFPTSDENEMFCSLKKLSMLPDATKVYCGHGENTTIGDEKQRNGYMQYAAEKY